MYHVNAKVINKLLNSMLGRDLEPGHLVWGLLCDLKTVAELWVSISFNCTKEEWAQEIMWSLSHIPLLNICIIVIKICNYMNKVPIK